MQTSTYLPSCSGKFSLTVKMIRLLLISFISLSLMISCDKKEETTEEECCPWCLGPKGGEVEITDQDNPMVGVKIVIPPGAWDHCRAFSIEEKYVYAPPFPSGFHPYYRYDMAFGIQAGGDVPDSLYMDIYLPLNNLAYESGEVLCAFYYDEQAERWRIRMPDEIANGFLVINTHLYHSKWSWGKVVLSEADWGEDLEPLLKELQGEDHWEDLKSELTRIYESVIEEDMDLTCANINLAYNFFVALKNEAGNELIEFQNSMGNVCGVCDATSIDFYDEYITYIEKNIEYFLVELFFFENGPNLLIQAYGFMRLCEIMDDIDNLACDYECFFAHTDQEFSENHAAFLIAAVMVELFEYAETSGYTNCN